ncbi:MAG TPA: DUF4082 domain-containing protein [Mycobacteriales bacterium]|nr:DUF4082 domain-containing protein [Mycobacteriales bacterium]
MASLLAVAVVPVAVALPATPALAASPCTPPVANPVACENTLPGTPEDQWRVDASDPSIVGFSTDISTNVGGRVDFKVSTDAASWRIDIYRLGWYGGDGARLVDTVTPLVSGVRTQPDCLSDSATGLNDCGNWSVSASWQVPATAVSGLYYGVLRRADTGGENEIFFVVRNDASHSDLYFQTSDETWQAYNKYGGNSLYTGTGPGANGAGFMVSYNRPLSGSGAENLPFNAEVPMIRFLERNGYDISYESGVDSDRFGSLIGQHRVFLSVGHDEYWSAGQRSAVEAARAAGVNLAFFSGNEMFWKTRWLPSTDTSATAYRTMVCYKETRFDAKIDPTSTWTGSWRDTRFAAQSDGNQPENALIGQMFLVNGYRSDAMTVPAAYGKMRLWRDTPLASMPAGDVYSFQPGTLGYEWDSQFDNGLQPPGVAALSSTTVDIPTGAYILRNEGDDYSPGTATHTLTLYRDQTGHGLVFAAGTVQWAWGLDDYHSFATPTPTSDIRIQQATVNLFADMGAQPASLVSTLVPATASTDTAAPAVTVSTPSPATPTVGSPVTFGGAVTDAAGQVAGVEVSVGGGAWHPATWQPGSTVWSYSYLPSTSGTLTVRVRAVDDSANLSAPASQTDTIVPRTCPCSVFSADTVPASPALPDTGSFELGVKWQSSVDGYVSGVRFYKGTGNTGTHTGTLWSADGTLLATGTFANETATGWQTLSFGQPVHVTANTTYVASYHTSVGHYAADIGYFADRGVLNEPLSEPQSSTASPNGVFRSGASGFPSSTFKDTNYYVDVVFDTTPPPDNRPPQVAATSPAAGAGGAELDAPVTVTFDEPVDPASVAFTVTDATGPVAGTVALNAAGSTANFTPSAPLAAGATYTASVLAADPAHNAMPAPVSWQFTTGIPRSSVCPCSVWDDFTVPDTVNTPDANAIEVGTKVRFDTKGFVTGVRFYKGSQNTGTHTGSLWSSTGTRLATGTFTSETSSGWQTLTFAEPVSVQANTTYVVSYHTDTGFYSSSRGYFGAQEASFGAVHALRSGVDGSNGVFRYGAGGFPASSFSSTNYWVDVLFTNSLSGDITPPTVTSASPADGATGVSTSPSPAATFDEALDPETVRGSLRDRGGAAVAVTVSYDATAHTVTLAPTAPLPAGERFTASVTAADASDNVMSAPFTWAFTTSTVRTCPCTLFSTASVPTVASSTDTTALDLGVRFTSDTAEQVTGVRFYKGAGNTGTHTGSLWSADGTLLATGTFGGETATGWQTLTFAAPVPIAAGQVYVASYTTTTGGYAVDNTYFEQGEATSVPLHAPATGVGSPNGVYAVGIGFPTSTYRGSNYWVDVLVSPATATPAGEAATLVGQSETQSPASAPSAGPTAPAPARQPTEPVPPVAVLPANRRPSSVPRPTRRGRQ